MSRLFLCGNMDFFLCIRPHLSVPGQGLNKPFFSTLNKEAIILSSVIL